MKTPKISVIIPVYNAEKDLHRCIDSILAQTFRDFELLLVDDGSKDISGEICDDYAQKDERVRVFHLRNGGASSARNVGLDNAHGYWVTFVDSDDYISENFLATIDLQDCDLVILQNQHFSSQRKIFSKQEMSPQKFDGKNAVRIFLAKHLLYHIMLTPWGKLYKRNLIANIRFDKSLRIGEDVVFVHQYLLECSSICVVEGATYYYNDEDENFCNKYRLEPQESLNHLIKIINQYRKLEIYNPQFEAFELNLFFSLCKENMKGNSKIWFNNSFICQLIESCKSKLSLKVYLKYQLFKVPWFYDMCILSKRI